MVLCPSPKLFLSTQHCLPTCWCCRPQCTEIQPASSSSVLGALSFVVRTLLSGMLERTAYSLISYQPRKLVLNSGHFHHLNHTLKAECFIFRCTVYLCCHTFKFLPIAWAGLSEWKKGSLKNEKSNWSMFIRSAKYHEHWYS